MLDIYIIEQIRKREEDRRRIDDRPALELPLDPPLERRDRAPEDSVEEESPRVIEIDL